MSDKIKQHFELVREWAEARNLIAGATPQAQFVKLLEEISEFTAGITAQDLEEVKDGLGDSVVVLTILAAQLGTSIENCLDRAFSVAEEMYKVGGWLGRDQNSDALIHILVTSVGELATGISKKDSTKVEFGIGGAFFAIEAIAERFYMNLEDCFEYAYNQIKDRKGKMLDGVFVKEADFAAYGIAS